MASTCARREDWRHAWTHASSCRTCHSHRPPGTPAGTLSCAIYRERCQDDEVGTDIDGRRSEDGGGDPVKLDLVRFGIPRKTYLRGHLDYIVDRLVWLWEHRDLVRGLK